VADAFRYAAYCHCSNCRRTTGSAFKPFAGIERAKLAVVEGQDRLLICGDENANDTHCAVLIGGLFFALAILRFRSVVAQAA